MPKRLPDEVYSEPYFQIVISGKTVPPSKLQFVTDIQIDDEEDKHIIGRINIVDRDRVWTNDSRIKKGTPISIRMGHRKHNRVMLSGKIQNLEADYPEDGYPSMTIVCTGNSYSMSEEKKTRTWKNKKISDVCNAIFKEHGIKATVADTGKVIPHIVQSNETDFDFVKRKLKEIGKSLPAEATAMKKNSGNKVDYLYYRKTVHSQIISFTPSVFDEETELASTNKSKSQKTSSKSNADVNIKKGTVESSSNKSSSSKGSSASGSSSGGSKDSTYASIDKNTGKVTIKEK